MNALTQPAALAASPEHQPDRLHRRVRRRAPGVAQSLNPGLYRIRQRSPPVGDGPTQAQALRGPGRGRPGITALLLDRNEQAGIINAEMGTGKTMMAIAVAAVMHAAGYRRTLVVSPPHLVYKWRREILEPSQAPASGYSTAQILYSSCSSCEIRWATPTTGARSSSSSAACGCGWVSTGDSPAGGNAPLAVNCSLRARIAARSPETWKQPGHGGGVRAW